MNALVQEIEDDLDTGLTTYHVGPPGHLTVQTLMAMLNYTRTRTEVRHAQERKNGAPSAPTINGTTMAPGGSGGSPPNAPGVKYPWIDFIDEQDNDDGSGATWDALLGYGQSDFAGSDAIDHAGPLEKFELSVGNDGSYWTGPMHDSESLFNCISLISGDSEPINDQLLIGRTDSLDNGGSVIITPYEPSLAISPNLDGSIDSTDDTGR